MKKTLLILLTVIMVLAVAGCSANTAAPSATQAATGWKVTVEGASKAEFKQSDYAALKETTIEATSTKKDGTKVTSKYTGVLIGDVVKALGASEYSKITLTAQDGFTADITKDMLSDKAVFATKVDGKDLEDASKPVMSVLDGQATKTWVKGITKITFAK